MEEDSNCCGGKCGCHYEEQNEVVKKSAPLGNGTKLVLGFSSLLLVVIVIMILETIYGK